MLAGNSLISFLNAMFRGKFDLVNKLAPDPLATAGLGREAGSRILAAGSLRSGKFRQIQRQIVSEPEVKHLLTVTHQFFHFWIFSRLFRRIVDNYRQWCAFQSNPFVCIFSDNFHIQNHLFRLNFLSFRHLQAENSPLLPEFFLNKIIQERNLTWWNFCIANKVKT